MLYASIKRMLRVYLLCSQVPGLGHIPNLVKSMGSSNDAVVKSAVQVVHLLSANEVRHTIVGGGGGGEGMKFNPDFIKEV